MPREIYEALVNRKELVSFHMPGHKSKLLDGMEAYLKNILKLDVTELEDTDELYHPLGIIKKSEEKVALFSHAKKSKFLVNGASSGILATILALVNPGESILLEENCHKSAINAARLARAKIYKIAPADKELVASQESLIKMAKEIKNLRMIFITRPNYYGIYQPIGDLVSFCRENKILLVVDEAHGSHFALDIFDKNAMEEGAHVSINSFHKTLPAFTQTAVLNLNLSNDLEEKILNSLEMTMTSSPSYIFMTSIEYALDFSLKNKDRYRDLKKYIDNFYEEIRWLDFIEKDSCPPYFKRDFTRLVLKCKNPSEINKHLIANGIYIEMHDDKRLVLIGSLADDKKDYDLLARAIKSYKNKKTYKDFKTYDDLEGKILAKDIVVYPPGKIILERGNPVTKELIEELNTLSKSDVSIYL